ncbi:MAG: putative lipid II flippase FtsW [Gammaproteobacteria bacterium]|nr:putative lipid II flippase FtsW [Gammaproteobacteria bacterium]
MSSQAIRASQLDRVAAPSLPKRLDSQILLIFGLLAVIGLIMVTSASIGVADAKMNDPFYYGKRQFLRLLLGVLLMWIAYRVPTSIWKNNGMILMLSSLFLLALVLVPGVGRTVNGATRWLDLIVFTIQVSEIAKLFLIIYLSGYLIRRCEEIQSGLMGFVKPMIILAMASGLLLLEPDFGAAAVLLMTGLGMIFLGGVQFKHFIIFVIGTLSIMVLLVLASPYRMARVTSFLDPWADPFSSGFQLTQSLIAIGSGGIYGTGLGGSIQKLFYLPEAHTDFLFAIYAEEFGLIGAVFLILIYAWFVLRCFQIGKTALNKSRPFGAYLVYGVGLLVSIQALINMGVNLGALPTKGLTLPFISYGGNSILIMSFAVGLVLRVHYENSEPSDGRKKPRKRSPRVVKNG